jgi:zinc transporter, ZIP family
MLDGVPEPRVLGLSVAHSCAVSIAFVFAVAISNVPQGLGGTVGMLAAGWPRNRITKLWVLVCVLSVAAGALGDWIGSLSQDGGREAGLALRRW